MKFNRTQSSKPHNFNFHVSDFFDYAPGINCFVYSWTVFWYTSKASTESLWTVDSKKTNSRPWKIPVSAAEALKFNRTQCSKPHNFNFHVSLFRLCTWNKLLCIFMDCLLIDELSESTESLWTVDSINTIFRAVKNSNFCCRGLEIQWNAICSKPHNINFHVSLFRLCTWNKLLCIFMDCLLIDE